jgi:transcription-repair coupling factor (superfamily II helicase)
VRVDARVDAYVPVAYLGSEALRIDLHRRLALTDTEDELRELRATMEERYGPLPEPVENLFAIQEAKLKVAQLGADYLVFRGGKATVGKLVLGSAELRQLRGRIDTAVYTGAQQEVSLRDGELKGAIRLVDAILSARQAA